MQILLNIYHLRICVWLQTSFVIQICRYSSRDISHILSELDNAFRSSTIKSRSIVGYSNVQQVVRLSYEVLQIGIGSKVVCSAQVYQLHNISLVFETLRMQLANLTGRIA